MKNNIFLSVLVSCLLATSTILSQESKNVKPVFLSFSSGQGALSSGPLFNGVFSTKNDLASFTIGERDVYFVYMKNIFKNTYVGPVVEYYHNIPVVGLMANIGIYSKEGFKISSLHWIGISAGKPGLKAEFNKWQLLFIYNSINLDYKRISASGAMLYYEKKWGYLFELKYKQPLTKNFSAFTTAGYNFYGEGNYLFSIGISYLF
jgi:hypothetical protein